jgi:hypothetical protein
MLNKRFKNLKVDKDPCKSSNDPVLLKDVIVTIIHPLQNEIK